MPQRIEHRQVRGREFVTQHGDHPQQRQGEHPGEQRGHQQGGKIGVITQTPAQQPVLWPADVGEHDWSSHRRQKQVQYLVAQVHQAGQEKPQRYPYADDRLEIRSAQKFTSNCAIQSNAACVARGLPRHRTASRLCSREIANDALGLNASDTPNRIHCAVVCERVSGEAVFVLIEFSNGEESEAAFGGLLGERWSDCRWVVKTARVGRVRPRCANSTKFHRL